MHNRGTVFQKQSHIVKFEFPMAVRTAAPLLWNVTPCSLTGKSFIRNVGLPAALHRIISKRAAALLTSC